MLSSLVDSDGPPPLALLADVTNDSSQHQMVSRRTPIQLHGSLPLVVARWSVPNQDRARRHDQLRSWRLGELESNSTAATRDSQRLHSHHRCPTIHTHPPHVHRLLDIRLAAQLVPTSLCSQLRAVLRVVPAPADFPTCTKEIADSRTARADPSKHPRRAPLICATLKHIDCYSKHISKPAQ